MGSAMAAPPPELRDAISRRLADPVLAGARIGIYIQSLRDGDFWYTSHEFEPFIPASNAKIFTAAMAVHFLTPNYVFHTQLYTDGEVKNGELEGNLYLRGGGDPTLDVSRLRELRQYIPARKIAGRLYLDDSFFSQSGPLRGPWEQEDYSWGYAAPSSALSCEGNAETLIIRGVHDGQPASLSLTPDDKLMTVVNQAKTANNAQPSDLTVAVHDHHILVTGKLPPSPSPDANCSTAAAQTKAFESSITEHFSVDDPTLFTGKLFRSVLAQEGITVGADGLRRVDPQRVRMLGEVQTSLFNSSIPARMMGDSDNLYAEQLRWTMLALKRQDQPLKLRYDALLQDFQRDVDMQLSGMRLVDGSGLSRENRLSPFAIARCLIYLKHIPDGAVITRALPTAGMSGTLRERMVGTPAAFNAQAKTGTMRGVSALSGYVYTADHEPLVFSILVNDCRHTADARKLQDDLVSMLAASK